MESLSYDIHTIISLYLYYDEYTTLIKTSKIIKYYYTSNEIIKNILSKYPIKKKYKYLLQLQINDPIKLKVWRYLKLNNNKLIIHAIIHHNNYLLNNIPNIHINAHMFYLCCLHNHTNIINKQLELIITSPYQYKKFYIKGIYGAIDSSNINLLLELFSYIKKFNICQSDTNHIFLQFTNNLNLNINILNILINNDIFPDENTIGCLKMSDINMNIVKILCDNDKSKYTNILELHKNKIYPDTQTIYHDRITPL
jgi:hypothetical protein